MPRQHIIAIVLIAVIFPFVEAAPPNSVLSSECRSLIDLVLVVDGSDSISAIDYDKQRLALAEMISGMEIKPTASRVGIVVYSSSISQVIPLSFVKTNLVKQATRLLHPRDGTKTSLGIAKMLDLFKDGRNNVPWVCIVITDGLSKSPNDTAAEAKRARDAGVNMFAVGISNHIEKEELLNIASSKDQVLELQSFDQLRVSLRGLMKVVCPCPLPPPVTFGEVNNGSRAKGSVRNYTCEDGYQPMGNPAITCGKDSIWTTLEFSCNACPEPMNMYGNGIVSSGLRLLGSVREYNCGPGYTAPAPLLSTCMEGPNGPFWTKPTTTCSGCPKPPIWRDTYLDLTVGDTLIGSKRLYHCAKGFIPTGPIESACIDSKGVPEWTKPVHGCKACRDPPILPYATVDKKGHALVGTVRVYSCHPGFHPTGPIEAICMGENGAAFWRTTENVCIACKDPPILPNAVLNKGGDTLVGSVRTYQCLKGFQHTGPIELRCTADRGKTFWEGPHHKCVACIAPPRLPNAILDPIGDTLIGSIRAYKCMKGYIPSGPMEVGCIKGTGGPLWTSPEYQCISCPPPHQVPYAVIDPTGDNRIGSKRHYRCINGYIPSMPGPIVSECIGDYKQGKGVAFWSDPSHFCRSCPDPPPIDFAQLEGVGKSLIGSTRTYICTKGFYATGPISIKCMDDGHWSKPNHSCTACGPIHPVPHAFIDDGSHQLGTVRFYTCKPGYTASAPPEIICLKNAEWSQPNFTCIACKNPYGLSNAVLEPGENLIGMVRRYTCLPGFLATGPITSTCALPTGLKGPDWSTPVHYCKDCGDAYPVDNAIAVKGKKTIGAVQQYMCKSGYVPSAPPLSHCMPNAEWTPPVFKCIVCGVPPSLLNARVDTIGDTMVGTIRTYTCDIGYIATGPMEIICDAKQVDGFQKPYWKKLTDNYCKDCGLPPNVTHGFWLDGPKTLGSVAQYVCDSGYTPSGPPETACDKHGVWAQPNFNCTGCMVTPVVQYAQPISTVLPMYTTGSVITYECIPGYVAVGKPELTCQSDATWSLKQFSCIITCNEPESYIDAMVDGGGNLFGDVRVYACNLGLKLIGDATITCQETGIWTPRAFECSKCLPASEKPYAIPMSGDSLIGSEVLYQCKEGYKSDAPVISTCQLDLTWSTPAHNCYGCMTTPIIYNTLPLTGELPMYMIGTTLTYECIPGFLPTSTPILQCLPDGSWSIQEFQCVISCGNPPMYTEAVLDQGGILSGDVRQYTCVQGLKTAGVNTITCQASGSWSERLFNCTKCLPASEKPYAIPTSGDSLIGSEVLYQCKEGYKSDGPVISTCQLDLTWSIPTHNCYGCMTTPIIDNTLPLTGELPMYMLGTILTYECIPGFLPTSTPTLQCLPDGSWSIQEFQCVISCGNPPMYTEAVLDQGGIRFGDVRQYTCVQGLKTAGVNTITCQATGSWSERLFNCTKCLPASEKPYSIPTSGDSLIGSEVLYQCKEGYKSDGPVISTCQLDLTWSTPAHNCYGCMTTPIIDNTLPLTGELPMYMLGTILTYECIPGFLPTSTPILQCLPDGSWSIQEFQCVISCGIPPTYADAVLDQGGILLGNTRHYTCVQGLKTVGENIITCQPTGAWSQRLFNCKKCMPAPELEYAIPLVGESFIGSEAVYQCKDGFKADGPVASVCQGNLTWSIPTHVCYDCGAPPAVSNAYFKLGQSTIGSIRHYSCEGGYDMNGKDNIVCLPNATWSQPTFNCYVRTTTTTTTPAPIPEDPSICDGCRMFNGVGFINHPYDCTQYIQCYYGTRGIESVIMPCPFGQYWDQGDLTCKPADDVDCPTERCLNPMLQGYKHTDSTKCCAYWTCNNGKSEPKCCGSGTKFDEEYGCVADPTCMASCPWEDEFLMCDKRPLQDITRYEQHIGNGFWIKMACAPGTGFSALDCECCLDIAVVPGYACRPELLLDFDDDDINDVSGRNVYVYNEGVTPYKGAAYFNGNSRLVINRFSNTAFHGHFVLKLRYKEQLNGPTANELQALITNGDCGDDPTIIVAKMPGYVLCGAKTERPKSFALPTTNKEWKEVIYIHDEKKLEGKVCGASYNKWSWGPIKSTHCGIQIGHGSKLANFVGLMDDITLFQCRPDDSILTVYGGQRPPAFNSPPPTMNVH